MQKVLIIEDDGIILSKLKTFLEQEGYCASAKLITMAGAENSNYKFEAETSLPSIKIMEDGLRLALQNNELEVYFQPQLEVHSRHLAGAEALLRWNHPEQGTISPDIFIPVAEATGLIHPIGEWVLKTACEQLKAWQDAGQPEGQPELRMAVNVSISQLYDQEFCSKLARIIQETGIDPTRLELEVTESVFICDLQTIKASLDSIKSLGVLLSIDDFGTGYSALRYLKQLPFDKLKIARYFVQNLGKDLRNSAITLSMIQMAHNLNLKVIAEGVETKNEMDFLRNHGCDEIQGYYFCKPMNAYSFQQYLDLTGSTNGEPS